MSNGANTEQYSDEFFNHSSEFDAQFATKIVNTRVSFYYKDKQLCKVTGKNFIESKFQLSFFCLWLVNKTLANQ